MEELGIPSRLFETGFEPTGRKRVNNYFNLRWIELIKSALDDDQLAMLYASQFGKVLQMGAHTFSVMFVHYILSRQLVTDKEFELWWLFAGKPIRYAIQDFALVTGLNCGEVPDKVSGPSKSTGRGKASSSSTSIWDSLFRGEDKPTASWIMDRLIMGKKYKDPLTRLRLAMLIIVEGILCPTCGATKIRPEVVSLLENLDEFLQYPWGRESFLLTVRSANAHGAGQYVQDTMAIQGFTHAMVLVTVIACPAILGQSIDVDSVASVSEQSKGILSRLLNTKMAVNVVSAKTLDQKGQAIVRPFVCSDEDGECLYGSLLDKSDDAVDKMVALNTEDYPFEHNSWPGGVKADALKLKKCQQNPSESSAENILKEMDTKNRNQSGVDSGVRNPEPNRQSPRSNDEDTTFGRTEAVDVPALLRLAADAYEERLMPLFEGYVLSLKAYFDTKVAGLDTSLMAATTSIRELEIFVKSEFAKRSDSFSNQAYGDPLGTFTPTTNPSPNWGPSDKLQNEDVSVYPPSKSANEDNRAGNTPGQNQSKPPNPSAVMSDTHPPQSEDDIVAGDQAPTHPPGSEDAQSTDVPSAANASGCVMAVSTAAESVSTAPHIPATVGDNIVRNDTEEGVNEDLHPNLAEDTRPSKEAKVRRGGSESIGGKLEGTRRVSRRRHNSPQRYTPTEYTIRKKPTNKRGGRGG